MSQDIPGWRGPWKTSNPNSCLGRLSSEASPGCSALYPVDSPGMENHCATCGTVLVEKKLFPLPSLNISFMLYNLCLLCFTLQPYTTTKGPGSIFCCPWVLGSCCRVHPEATWRKLQAEQALLLQPHQSL